MSANIRVTGNDARNNSLLLFLRKKKSVKKKEKIENFAEKRKIFLKKFGGFRKSCNFATERRR